MGVILLKRQSTSPWQFDSTNNIFFMEILGTRVVQIDSNGNLSILGKVLSL